MSELELPLHALSLADASRRLATGTLSSVALTEAMLARIDMLNPRLHAFATVTAESARREAHAADAAIARGEWRGPLHGIPIALKDNIETRDVLTTAYSNALADYVPAQDAACVHALRTAGAVLLGKVALHEFAYGTPSPGDPFPAARNPWNTAHSPGGSSSGSAVAVATGMAMAALGTDTAGSIRAPAAFCGVVGLMPGADVISNDGVIPVSPSQDRVGPIARSVQDTALMFDAMTGRHHADSLVADHPSGDASDHAKALAGLRLGVPLTFIESTITHPEVLHAFDNALRRLQELGATIEPVAFDFMDGATAAGAILTAVDAWQYHQAGIARHPERYGAALRARLAVAGHPTIEQLADARATRTRLNDGLRALLADRCDVILSPTRETPAPLMTEMFNTDPTLARGITNRMYNLSGLPALAVPMGLTKAGLPVSLQIGGGEGTEGKLLQVGRVFERMTNWVVRPLLD